MISLLLSDSDYRKVYKRSDIIYYMIKKEDISPLTVSSEIVKRGIKAVEHIDLSPELRSHYFIVGGTAVQSYLPSQFHRPTADIDVWLLYPISNKTEFVTRIAPCVEYLQDEGYQTSIQKKSRNFSIGVAKDNEDPAFYIEFSRRNLDKYKEVEARLIRERRNIRQKKVDDAILRVAAPEDIAIPKLVRGVGTLSRRSHMREIITRKYSSQLPLQQLLYDAIQARASLGDGVFEDSRIQSDLYDITSLNQFVGYNKDYFEQASLEWTRARESSGWNFLCNLLSLPCPNNPKQLSQ